MKDDLIVKVDELTSEQEILREEMKCLHSVKSRLKQRVADLEEELKRVKEEAAKQTKNSKSDDEVCQQFDLCGQKTANLKMSFVKSVTKVETGNGRQLCGINEMNVIFFFFRTRMCQWHRERGLHVSKWHVF